MIPVSNSTSQSSICFRQNALVFGAIQITKFLLFESGLDTDYLIEQSQYPLDSFLSGCLSHVISWPECPHFPSLFSSERSSTGDRILSLLCRHWDDDKKLRSQFSWQDMACRPLWCPPDGWVTAFLPFVSVAKACGFGFTIWDFAFFRRNPPFVVERIIDLYLASVGDPDYIWLQNRRGPLLLSKVLGAIWEYTRVKEWLISDEECIQWLVRVIDSGANVYALIEDGCGRPEYSLSDEARSLRVEGYWGAALAQCGYSVAEVRKESALRLVRARRALEGLATGVDADIVDLPEVRGLRRRDGSDGHGVEF